MNKKDYFSAFANYFWQWEEGGNVLAIPNDKTIAYTQLVLDYFQKTRLQGIPEFSTFIACVIATNPGASDTLLKIKFQIQRAITDTQNQDLDYAFAFLQTLSNLPENLKTGDYRLLVFQHIFYDGHNNISVENARQILDEFENSAREIWEILPKKPLTDAIIKRHLKPLALLHAKYPTPQALLKSMTRMLPAGMIQLQLESGGSNPQQILDEMDQLASAYRVSSLVRHLWGGLQIPVHNAALSAQPLGGISDLTNKGQLDKILISEFANEDIVLMSRLANNEALYIHREIPPVKNETQRIILIDQTLKNWGTPQKLAFATALSIAFHPKTDYQCSLYAVGNNYSSINLSETKGILQALQIQEAILHPAEGLKRWFKDFKHLKDPEIIFISESGVYENPEIARLISTYSDKIKYLIHTQADGNINVIRKWNKTQKEISHIQLNTYDIWKKNTPKKDKDSDILQSKNPPSHSTDCPILLRLKLYPKLQFNFDQRNYFSISRDGGLFHTRLKDNGNGYFAHTQGHNLLIENLRININESCHGTNEHGEPVLCLHNSQLRELNFINLITLKVHVAHIEDNAQFRSNHLYFYYPWFVFRGKETHVFNSRGQIVTDHQILPTDYAVNINNTPTQNTYVSKGGLLTAVNFVAINSSNELCVNKHCLTGHESYKYLQFQKNNNLNYLCNAEQNKSQKNIFTFADGSTFTVNKNGYYVLKSSSPEIKDITIPAFLDSSLGIAAGNNFGGIEYYSKPYLLHVYVKYPQNKNSLGMVANITNVFENVEIHRINKAEKILVKSYCDREETQELLMALEHEGWEAFAEDSPKYGKNHQNKYDVWYVYKQFIQPFINHILAYENKI